MSIVFTDLEALIIIATLLIVVYIIGTYWKHRTLTRYAHWFEENLSKKGKVKFASHGHAGLRVKYKGPSTMREIDFALTLGARENLIYYPYSIFARDFDKLNCWAILSKPIRSNLKITKQKNKKIIKEAENAPRLSTVESNELNKLGYVIYATDHEYAHELASKASIANTLKKSKNIELIEFDKLSSRLHLVGKLSRESLPVLVSFIFELGRLA